ncbi:MAG: hypothetical protein AAB131_17010 [Actinomycetota bacterium]
MRKKNVAVALILAPLAIAAMVGAAATAAPVACGPVQIGGVTVRTWCGPAKATVKLAGKTRAIKGGACELVNFHGIKAFTVNTGRYTVPPAKPKFTSFSAAGSDTKPGTYTGWLINFQTPGKQWIFKLQGQKVTITKAGGKAGTFSGKLDGGGTASGSWTC